MAEEDITRLTQGFSIRDQVLIRQLDGLVADIRATFPGRRASRESLSREMLYFVLARPRLLAAITGLKPPPLSDSA